MYTKVCILYIYIYIYVLCKASSQYNVFINQNTTITILDDITLLFDN